MHYRVPCDDGLAPCPACPLPYALIIVGQVPGSLQTCVGEMLQKMDGWKSNILILLDMLCLL